MRRTSSPGAYSLCSANSTEAPWCGERCSPASAPSTTTRARTFKSDSDATATGSSTSIITGERRRGAGRPAAPPSRPATRLEVGDQAVLQRRAGERAHVFDGGGVAAVEDGARLGAEDQVL